VIEMPEEPEMPEIIVSFPSVDLIFKKDRMPLILGTLGIYLA
jgi:hypothetical protein